MTINISHLMVWPLRILKVQYLGTRYLLNSLKEVGSTSSVIIWIVIINPWLQLLSAVSHAALQSVAICASPAKTAIKGALNVQRRRSSCWGIQREMRMLLECKQGVKSWMPVISLYYLLLRFTVTAKSAAVHAHSNDVILKEDDVSKTFWDLQRLGLPWMMEPLLCFKTNPQLLQLWNVV